ncbi:hypothetical protein Bbelb_083150 [Branchiostoma belcheri]|nr:hypothetical protein Bbelb_083150 [Branchiostoma belcheri]
MNGPWQSFNRKPCSPREFYKRALIVKSDSLTSQTFGQGFGTADFSFDVDPTETSGNLDTLYWLGRGYILAKRSSDRREDILLRKEPVSSVRRPTTTLPHSFTALPQRAAKGYTFHSALPRTRLPQRAAKVRGRALWKVYPLAARYGRAVEEVCGSVVVGLRTSASVDNVPEYQEDRATVFFFLDACLIGHVEFFTPALVLLTSLFQSKNSA